MSAEPDFAGLSARTGLSEGALRVLWAALLRTRGALAQFDHAELGGMGQWMRGGMTQIGDMFNSALAAKVAMACALMAEQAASGEPPGREWWPVELGTPSSTAGQNDWAYALFPAAGRLVVLARGVVTLYDVSGVEVRGVGMQSGTTVVYTASGARPLESFPRASAAR